MSVAPKTAHIRMMGTTRTARTDQVKSGAAAHPHAVERCDLDYGERAILATGELEGFRAAFRLVFPNNGKEDNSNELAQLLSDQRVILGSYCVMVLMRSVFVACRCGLCERRNITAGKGTGFTPHSARVWIELFDRVH